MATTFDPGVLIGGGSLSGGNLVFTSSAAGNAATNRTLTGKTYCEITATTVTGTPSVGVVGRNWASVPVGNDATSCGYSSSGAVKYNATTLATLSTFTSGDRIGIAIDWLNRLIWFRVNNGNWNGSVSNDPATGVGGLSFAAPSTNVAVVATGLIGVATSASGTVWTAKFSSPFTDTVPTGYSSMDTTQIALARSTDMLDTALPAVALSTTAIAQTAFLPGSPKSLMAFSPSGTITNVSGTTKESGVAVGGKRVDVYDRNTGELLGTTYSDGSGNWSLPCVGRPKVRVVGSDPTTFNSVVYDNVVGV